MEELLKIVKSLVIVTLTLVMEKPQCLERGRLGSQPGLQALVQGVKIWVPLCPFIRTAMLTLRVWFHCCKGIPLIPVGWWSLPTVLKCWPWPATQIWGYWHLHFALLKATERWSRGCGARPHCPSAPPVLQPRRPPRYMLVLSSGTRASHSFLIPLGTCREVESRTQSWWKRLLEISRCRWVLMNSSHMAVSIRHSGGQ